ncbi:hypothetical protein D9M73_36730 [compost metagenome]
MKTDNKVLIPRLRLWGRSGDWVALAALTGALLAGCSSKPPSCADGKTFDLYKSMLLNGITQRVTNDTKSLAGDIKIQAQATLKKFLADTKFELAQVVTNSYSEQAKKYSCEGQLRVVTALEKYSFNAVYTTQSTVDAKADFLLEVAGFQNTLDALYRDFMAQYRADAEKRQ